MDKTCGVGIDDGRGETAVVVPQARSAWRSMHGPAMVAALVILVAIVAVGVLLNPNREDFRWFLQLRRPRWLTFERWIPAIWLAIYICFYVSALLAWQASTSLVLMGGYLGLVLLVQSYTWLICRSRTLRNGTLIGLAGWAWGVALAVVVVPLSRPAALLLIPFLLWSPVGSFVTWRMEGLNR
ncbi:tryptophan-rich sensory protein [Synechococcus sp. BA-124 BA4]|nr:tryptophan-rich sensory protein [Synechococcus sp. BA-124 BA4]MEA5398606.1 tryptophan-rich sensory protein [Synechococcus sp. BA-124 BA4]